MPTKFGEPISASDAQDYFNAYEKVKQQIAILRPPAGQYTQEANVYISSPKNAFVFERKLIETLFAQTDSNKKSPEYLMVHFAAKFKNGIDSNGIPYEIGEPTIVVLACNKKSKTEIIKFNADNGTNIREDADVFNSMENDFPADETPGGVTQPIFPAPIISPTSLDFIFI